MVVFSALLSTELRRPPITPEVLRAWILHLKITRAGKGVEHPIRRDDPLRSAISGW